MEVWSQQSEVLTGQPTAGFVPLPPRTLAETGLSRAMVTDLVIKTIAGLGIASPAEISRTLRLSYYGILEPLIDQLRDQGLCSTASTGSGQFSWVLTESGRAWAADSRARSQYFGSAPVTLEDYRNAVQAQSIRANITPDAVQAALQTYVVESSIVDVFGPAVRSGTSVFLFGPPGNGKTSLARAAASLLGGSVYLPRAVCVGQNVITLYDPNYHEIDPTYQDEGEGGYAPTIDTRWVLIHRPFIMVGGELRLEDLELVYDHVTGMYQAALQMKANNGALLIDDFGRQRVPPRELLNRWIVPLERRVDFLTLHTGQRMEIPFEVLIIFSTNLEPRDLVDEAFLRRIRYKVRVNPPTEPAYREIMRKECEKRGIRYEDIAVTYLLEEYYKRNNRELRACEPRDLLDQVQELAAFRGVRPSLVDKKMLDTACANYFAKL